MSATSVPLRTTALRAGLDLGAARMRHRSVPVIFLVSIILSITAGLIERAAASTGAADRALGSTFGWIVPLATLALVTRASARDRLVDAVWSLARYGLPRGSLVVGLVLATAFVAASIGALVGAATVLAAEGGGVAAVMDALVCARIGALAAIAYTGLFALGSSLLARGGGRTWLFLLDLVLGSTRTAGLVLPRGHVEGLLGGVAPLHFPQIASSGMLLALALLFTLGAASRSR